MAKLIKTCYSYSMESSYKRRMPRFSKIRKIEFPANGRETLENFEYPEELIPTVLTLRRLSLDPRSEITDIAYKALKKSNKDSERVQEMERNRGFIENCDDYDTLFSLLSQSKGMDGLSRIVVKLMAANEDLLEDIFDGLRNPYNELFMDNSLRVIYAVLEEHPEKGQEIIKFLSEDKVRDPIDFSSILMTLLATKSREHLDWLYTFFIFFQDNFPDESHFLGPYYALMSLLNTDSVN